MHLPNNKNFAFTIIDDTEWATVENIKPVYDLLYDLGFLTTKTVWVYPTRDHFSGQSLQDEDYLEFIKDLKNKGFDIQMHNVGSGDFFRDEIISGIEIFKQKMGYYPSMQINHATNKDSLYWGYKRFGGLLKWCLKSFFSSGNIFFGDDPQSEHFWGDVAKKHIKYLRNRTFKGINTLKYDPKMPYVEPKKKYSNYWFSSSDGGDAEVFTKLISKQNVDKLVRNKGLCIVYTHLAANFVDNNGQVNPLFKERMEYLSRQNGWFVPASEILDYLSSQTKNRNAGWFYFLMMDIRWLIPQCIKKLKKIIFKRISPSFSK